MIHRDDRQIDVRTPACDRFDELLPDWLEGTLPASLRLEADRHRAECARCAALASDLQEIAHTAAALPRLRPDRDLWAGIAERIEPTVVPLDVRRVAADATPRRTYTFTRRWLGAAAAALVAVTSGITYIAVRPDGRTAPPSTASSATPAPTRVATADTQAAAPSAGAPSSTDTAAEPRVPDRGEPTRQGRGTSDARLASRSDAADAALVAAAATYDREIASLRAIVTRRRADLDSGTVAVLERNLRIIDQAIAQSRAALARDPRSQFLGEQLTRALDSKVELLRTAALLPQRGT